jgi:hypothetical protein
LNPRTHEAQLKDQKPRKAHLEEGKAARLIKGTKSDKTSQNGKKEHKNTKKLTKLKNSP